MQLLVFLTVSFISTHFDHKEDSTIGTTLGLGLISFKDIMLVKFLSKGRKMAC